MNSVACILCAGTNVDLRTRYRAEHPAFAGMMLAHCMSCGMDFAHPMPPDDALDRYNANYFDSAHGGASTGVVAQAFFSGIARLRGHHVERYTNRRSVAIQTVLEYGPGPGYFARNWLQSHRSAVYLGCETDVSCHASLQAVGVRLVRTGEPEVPTADLVVMSHVIEHVPRPEEFLLSATAGLRRDGALFIEVPCQDWRHKPFDEPHLLFFDKEPLRLLLQKAGFKDIEVSYHGLRIDDLRAPPAYQRQWQRLRTKLLSHGVVGPMGRMRRGMEILADPLERAAVAPFKAYCESPEPAWWLRAMATKN